MEGLTMLVKIDREITELELETIVRSLENLDLETIIIGQVNGQNEIGVIGQINDAKKDNMLQIKHVKDIEEIETRYKRASRSMHPENTVIQVGDVKVGGGHFAMIGGPCSIEDADQVERIAKSVKASGGNILRGGAFKPRTSPYDFQGLGKEGLEYMAESGKRNNLATVSEVMSINQIELFTDIDMFQVGARNMQNFDLLKALGKTDKPVLLKRGLANTIDELLMSAEYIMAHGNPNVILCERGIRTYETQTRNTLDVSAIPVLRGLTHLPIVVDPSHAAGKREWVSDLSLAAVAAGADGLIIEIHYNPEEAWSDGRQSLYLEQFEELNKKVSAVRDVLGLSVEGIK